MLMSLWTHKFGSGTEWDGLPPSIQRRLESWTVRGHGELHVRTRLVQKMTQRRARYNVGAERAAAAHGVAHGVQAAVGTELLDAC